MVRYNSLDDSTKQNLKEQIIECAVAIGGKNHFLSLIEEIRENREAIIVTEIPYQVNKADMIQKLFSKIK